MNNLTLLGLLILLLWAVIFAFYFYLARGQNKLQDDIDAVAALLDEDAPAEISVPERHVVEEGAE